MPVPSSVLMAVRRPEPVEGETLVPEPAAPVVAVMVKVSVDAAASSIRDLQARYCRRTIAVLGNGETAGRDHRRLMIPGDVGSAMTVGSDREISRIVIAAQRDGAGSIVDLQRAGIADADIRGTDTDQVDGVAEGEAGHGAAEMRDVIELQRGCSALKGDDRPRRRQTRQTPATLRCRS